MWFSSVETNVASYFFLVGFFMFCIIVRLCHWFAVIFVTNLSCRIPSVVRCLRVFLRKSACFKCSRTYYVFFLSHSMMDLLVCVLIIMLKGQLQTDGLSLSSSTLWYYAVFIDASKTEGCRLPEDCRRLLSLLGMPTVIVAKLLLTLIGLCYLLPDDDDDDDDFPCGGII